MKKVLKAVGIILLLLVIYFAAQSVVTFAIGIIRVIQMAVGSAAAGTAPDINDIMNSMMRYIGSQTPWVLIVAVVLTLPLYYLIYRGRRQELATFVSLQGIHPISVPVLIVFGVSLNIVIDMLLALVQQIPALKNIFNSYNQVANLIFGGGFVLTLIAVGIIGPIFEELLFRGLVFGELRKITRVHVAIVIQALLFGLYHMNIVQGSYAFLIGLLLGYIYYRSNSIYASMIVHITINSSSAIMGQFLGSDTSGGWGSALVIASLLLLILTGIFILTHRSFRHAMDNSLYYNSRLPHEQMPPDNGGQS